MFAISETQPSPHVDVSSAGRDRYVHSRCKSGIPISLTADLRQLETLWDREEEKSLLVFNYADECIPDFPIFTR